MSLKRLPHLKYGVLFAGALLPLAFSPFQFSLLAFISPAVLLWALLKTNSKFSAFGLGWYFGLGYFGVGVSWVFVSIHEFGETPFPLAALLTFLFVALLALRFGLQASLFYLLKPKKSAFGSTSLLFSAVWILGDYLQAHLGTGFPWLFLGYSQTNHFLSGFAPLGGVYLVSFLILLLSTGLVFIDQTRTKEALLKMAFVFSLVFSVALYLKTVSFTKISAQLKPKHITLLQGNIKPNEKFSHQPDALPIDSPRLYAQMSLAHPEANWIVWPENSMTLPLPDAAPSLKTWSTIAYDRQQTWFMGIPIETPSGQYYNSLISLGLSDGRYDKIHLVPFGEYLPFETLLRGLIHFFDLPMSDFVPGNTHQAILDVDGWKIAPAICYEVAFPDAVRRLANQANLILNLSEDGWFGASLGPHQHLQIAQFRALENQKPLIRATSSGISAFINPKGHIIEQTPQFQQTYLSQIVQAVEGQTPFSRYGSAPVLVLCLCISLFCLRRSTF